VKKQSLADMNLHEYVIAELSVLKNVRHPNLMEYIGCGMANETMYIVTEFLGGGDLQDLVLDKGQDLGWGFRAKIATDILRGLKCLHENNIIHRDIKPENCLLDNDWNCKLCDFGFARKDQHTRSASGAAGESRLRPRKSVCGTDDYMAPELFMDGEYGAPADIFSFGILLASIITRRKPGDDQFLVRRPQNMFELPDEELREAIPDDCPGSFTELCAQCCSGEPGDRPNAEDACEWAESWVEELPKDDARPAPIVPVQEVEEEEVEEVSDSSNLGLGGAGGGAGGGGRSQA
jgi:serine/threonine protein kinase